MEERRMPPNNSHQEISPKRSTLPCVTFSWREILLLTLFITPYFFLLTLSLGNGWTYPRLLPDRLDFTPWHHFFNDTHRSLNAFTNSLFLSIVVATLSTTLGLVVGYHLRRKSWLYTLVIFLPFVVSPMIVGLCLLDIAIRINLASTYLGIILGQFFFAFAFAAIFFSELWNRDIDRRMALVESLGGTSLAVFRHAVLPRIWPLIVVCWTQTAMFSWLDYGIISTIGGGVIRSLTLNLFAFIREGSVNQAAQAAIVLMTPPLLAMLIAIWLLSGRTLGRNRHE
jgi:ABC-type spermidine/putrescine transport system permease subunit II